MLVENIPLSAYDSQNLVTNLPNLELKYFKRRYPGDFTSNFYNVLSASLDYKFKTYTNFYLSDQHKLLDVFDQNTETIKKTNIVTPLIKDGYYLDLEDLDARYYDIQEGGFQEYRKIKLPKFYQSPTEIKYFTISFKNNNICNITHQTNNETYYLVSNDGGDLFFVRNSLLKTQSNQINAEDFVYDYSDSNRSLILYKKIDGVVKILDKNPDTNYLFSSNFIEDDLIKQTTAPFIISNGIFLDSGNENNNNFITYDTSNNINLEKTEENLKNNYLLYNKNINGKDTLNVLTLKNQLLQNEVFASGDNMLSGNGSGYFVDGLRDYTSISNSIGEKSDDLILNYVFHNKPYLIKPGKNLFKSPSNLYPYQKLNINDTKFIDCGAYSGNSPTNADRVYRVSDNISLKSNDQYLLCTWLSGSPFSDKKIWMDRYYYPDLIEKETALSAKNTFNPTYEDQVEEVIKSNLELKKQINKIKFFDKISDLCFIADENYIYERNTKEIVQRQISLCGNRYDYYTLINKSGKISFIITFDGNESSWDIYSRRNEIDSGISISKNNDELFFDIKMFDSESYYFDNKFFQISSRQKFIPKQKNFICISMDTVRGSGFIMLNNSVIENFKIPKYEFTNKKILYGNFFIKENNEEIELLQSYTVDNLLIDDDYTTIDDALFLKISLTEEENNNITITLPCGVRNSLDDIDLIQTFNPNHFKSNHINLYIKNTGIYDNSIIKNIKDELESKINNYIPVNTTIDNIQFNNFS